MSNPYINDINNFKKSVELTKINRARISSLGESKHSIDFGKRKQSNAFSNHVLGNADVPKKPETKANLKARTLFRRAFIQIRVINILISEKSLIQRLEISLRNLGL
jgi:hypothetical protein